MSHFYYLKKSSKVLLYFGLDCGLLVILRTTVDSCIFGAHFGRKDRGLWMIRGIFVWGGSEFWTLLKYWRRKLNIKTSPCCAASLHANAMFGSSSLQSPSRPRLAPTRLNLWGCHLRAWGGAVGVFCTVLRTASCTAHLRLQRSFILPDCIHIPVGTYCILYCNGLLEKYNQFSSSSHGVHLLFHSSWLSWLSNDLLPYRWSEIMCSIFSYALSTF